MFFHTLHSSDFTARSHISFTVSSDVPSTRAPVPRKKNAQIIAELSASYVNFDEFISFVPIYSFQRHLDAVEDISASSSSTLKFNLFKA